jgi:hypothetical protein
MSTAKLFQNRRLYAGAVINELIAAGELRVTCPTVEAFEEYLMPVGAAEAGDGLGRATPADNGRLAGRERFDIPDGFSKKPGVRIVARGGILALHLRARGHIFFVGCGAHATSAERASSIVAASNA